MGKCSVVCQNRHYRKTILPLITLAWLQVLSGLVIPTQAQTWDWIRYGGSEGREQANDMAIDENGNIFIIGSYGAFVPGTTDQTLYFDGGMHAHEGNYDVYIAKYDSAGNKKWMHTATGPQYDVGHGIALDKNGNIYITGAYRTGFNLFGTVLPTTSSGFWDAFYAKLDPSGNLLWVKTGSGDNIQEGTRIHVDDSLNVYIGGSFEDTLTIGQDTLISLGDEDLFLAKADSNGDIIWLINAGGGTGDKYFDDMDMDTMGNIYISATYKGPITVGGNMLGNNGWADAMVAKFNNNGQFLWAEHIGGSTHELAGDILVGDDGFIYTTGSFFNTITIGGTNLSSWGNRDIYLAKFDPNGSVRWARRYGNTWSEVGDGLAKDAEGNLYVAGWLGNNTDITGCTIEGKGSWDMIFLKYDTAGNPVWAQHAGGPHRDYGINISVDNFDNIITFGTWHGATLHIGSDTLPNRWDDDIYLARILDKPQTGIYDFQINGHINICETELNGLVYLTHYIPCYNYNWTITGGTITDGWNTYRATVDWDSTGTRSLQLIVCEGGYCDTTVINVQTVQAPVAGVSNDQNICAGDTTALSATGGTNYTWSPSAGLSADNMANPMAFPDSTTTYTVTVSTGSTCTDTASVTITVDTVPVVSLSGLAGPYCLSDSVIGLTGNPPGVTFNGPGINADSFYVQAAGTGMHVITYRYTDGNGCSADSSLTVVVHPLPAVSINELEPEYCSNSPLDSISGMPVGGTFTGNGMTDSIFNPALAGVGTHTITYAYTDNNGCTDRADSNVQVNGLPLPTFSGLSIVHCENDAPDTLTGLPAGGAFSGSITVDSIFDPAVAGPGLHAITYAYTDTNNCTNSFTGQTTVHPLPGVSFAGLSTSHCLGDGPIALTGSPAGGTFSGPGVNGSNFDPALAGLGIHTIIYTFTNGNGCTNDTGQVVAVHPNPTASFTSLAADYCANDGPVPLSGTPAGGTFSGPGVSGNNFDPPLAGPGTHEVTYTYSDTNSCSGAETQSVEVYALPTPIITWLDTDYCEDDTLVTLNGIPPGGIFSGPGMTNDTFDPKAAGPGQHSIAYGFTDANGCSDTAIANTSVHSLPVAIITQNGSVLTANDAVVYQWYLDGIPINGTTGKVYTASQNGSYTVKITDSNDCFDISDAVEVIIGGIVESTRENLLHLYPNPADDIIRIQASSDLKGAEIQMFDFMGRAVKIFGEINRTAPNSIVIDLQDLPAGVYFMQLKNGRYRAYRSVQIIR